MPGIVSYGAYVPPTRLDFEVMAGRPPREGAGERAIAWRDEDSLTMAVTAGVNCLRGFDRTCVDGVFFAGVTSPYREKQGAALIARALDLPRALRTADFSSSLRAGEGALCAALDAVRAGAASCVLVVASDCRLAAPGSAQERNFGDGAAAFLVGAHDVAAGFEGGFAFADEILDVWRAQHDSFVQSWEERFVIQEGYAPGIQEAVRGLLEKQGAEISDFAQVALYGPDARSQRAAARALGVAETALVDPCFDRLGNAGAAFAPLLLVGALERAVPGQRILLAGYGDGGFAHAFRAEAPLAELGARRGLRWHLARRSKVARYEHYLAARGLDAGSAAGQRGAGLSATAHHRERDDEIAFKAQRCLACGAMQFPAQRVCERCRARDAFESVRLSDKIGSVVTYTRDYFFPTPDPPTLVTIIDVEGARVHLQLVNLPAGEVRLGMPVEFEFRRIHEMGGRPNYYWKATPFAGPAAGEGSA